MAPLPFRNKVRKTIIIGLAALLAGFAAGRFSVPLKPAIPASALPPSAAPQKTAPTAQLAVAPQTQIRSIVEAVDPATRQHSLAELGASLGRTNPREGWALLASIPGLADRQSFAEALIKAWAAHDLPGALASCETLAAGELRATTLAIAAGVWAQHSPQEAASYSAAKLIGSARRSALVSVVQEWSRQNAQAAATWCLSQPEQIRGPALPEVMRYWANIDPKAAAQWAGMLAPEKRQPALEAIVTEWADQYPAEAAAWIAAQPGAGEFAEITAQSWAASDPNGAAQWALESRHTEALVPALATWAAADPVAASAWLGKNPTVPNHDELQQIILEAWSLEDPGSALSKLELIVDSKKRFDVRRSLLNDWQTRAPDEAAQWMKTHSVR